MLLLTRREGEGIVINGSIEVKVLEVRGGRVKLGFEYPAGNTVFRQELFAKIQQENQAAAQTLQPMLATPASANATEATTNLNTALQKLRHPRGPGGIK
ncbi:MAG: carbon storage regulator [Proteobacteria bacterium]|nr:carbon storage regulator [Pseudomonadota bacterium]